MDDARQGRISSVTIPTTGSLATASVRKTTYDALSRPISITESDGKSQTTFTYSGNNATTTDPNSHSTTNSLDALGRLIQVSDATSTLTQYCYDPLGNLLKVGQGVTGTGSICVTSPQATASQVRTFSYDSLSRLLSSTNPESGTITYTYDPDGNILTKLDQRGITTTYAGYDGLNRAATKSYSDGTPAVSYAYDQPFKGALTSIANSASSTVYNLYDSMGRVTKSTQTTAGFANPLAFNYQYNAAGEIELLTYPSGRVVQTCYDAANRVSAVYKAAQATSPTYASGILYTPQGTVSQLSLGNGLQENWVYSPDRLQPTAFGVGSLLALGYSYCPGGVASCSTNNGNVVGATVSSTAGNLNATQAFSYDALDRLTGASETANSSTTFAQSFAYDIYGNRALVAGGFDPYGNSTPQVPSIGSAVPFTNNRWNATTYDGAGNMTGVNGATYAYNAENRLKSATVPTMPAIGYAYDGNGQRVAKTVGANTTTYAYDASGTLMAEYRQSSETGTQYPSVDTLGSTRLVTDAQGNILERRDYAPFGEELYQGIGPRSSAYGTGAYPALPGSQVAQEFTGQERDAEWASTTSKHGIWPGHRAGLRVSIRF